MTQHIDPVPPADPQTDVLSFVDKHIGSFMQWELLRYFYTHPHAADTATQISGRIQRNRTVIYTGLAALTDSGLLNRYDFDDLVVYTLTEDPDLRHELDQFMTHCQASRLAYLQAVTHVMKRLGTE